MYLFHMQNNTHQRDMNEEKGLTNIYLSSQPVNILHIFWHGFPIFNQIIDNIGNRCRANPFPSMYTAINPNFRIARPIV